MRSGIGNSPQDPIYVTQSTATTDANGAPIAQPTYSTQSAPMTAGTDRSGSAATTSGQIVAANANRRGLEIQNIGSNNIGINEFGNTAAIGTAGTYTVIPGATMRIRTNRAITAIAATGATPFTATEW